MERTIEKKSEKKDNRENNDNNSNKYFNTYVKNYVSNYCQIFDVFGSFFFKLCIRKKNTDDNDHRCAGGFLCVRGRCQGAVGSQSF